MHQTEYKVNEGIAIMTLNNPDKMNALSSDILNHMGELLTKIEKDSALRVLIITGNEKVFGAGADINGLLKLKTVKDAHDDSEKTHALYNRIEALKIPTIAAVAGLALGGCLELALACDIRIASEGAKFGLPEVRLGVLPGAGGTYRLAKLIGPSRAKEWMFFGNQIDAAEAYRTGAVNKVVADGTVLDEAVKMAKNLAKSAPIALELIKSAVNTGYSLATGPAMELEAQCFGSVLSTEDAKEGINAFIEKRKAVFSGK